MPHAIGIDVGTTNVKKVLVDEAGRLVASASRGVSTLRSPNSVGQDAHALWDVVKTTITQLVSAAPEAAEVVALGCCSQYSSIVPVDSRGVPVADMVLWQDTNGTEYALTALEIAQRNSAPPRWLGRVLATTEAARTYPARREASPTKSVLTRQSRAAASLSWLRGEDRLGLPLAK